MTISVQFSNLSMSFEGITVLRNVDLALQRGEIHGLVGENGAGKSTLVKILGGVYTPDGGSECTLWGKPAQFPLRQGDHGVAIIHQDLALCDDMSVAENIGISSGFGSGTLGLYRKKREEGVVASIAEEFGLPLEPQARVASLSPAERSVVAILRALRMLRQRHSDQVLVLDEPTAALPHSESQRLIAIMRKLAAAGTTVLFISHRLQEVLGVCHRISVLRSGGMVGTVAASETTESHLVSMMLGYDLESFYPEIRPPQQKQHVFEVRGLSGQHTHGVSFGVAPGEIVGLTGLMGMGQDEIPYLINGTAPLLSGEVTVNGKTVAPSIRASLRAGISIVPANRARDSLWAGGTATENLTVPFLQRRFSKAGVLRRGAEVRFAREEMGRFEVRPPAPRQLISRFSGGNQQKLVIARWLHMTPRVLLLHEPTQGVDAGAKKDLFALIRDAAERGAAIVICSSDLEEVANVCHRVLVLWHGGIVSELHQDDLSKERLISATQASAGSTQKVSET